MSEIDDERAGLAAGLMTTAHELGGAFGVAIFSAVAVASEPGRSSPTATVAAAIAGAVLAALLALFARAAVPALRPTTVQQIAMH